MNRKPQTRRIKRDHVLEPSEPPSVAVARWLEILAGAELQHGHHAAAERLAWRAHAMREVAA